MKRDSAKKQGVYCRSLYGMRQRRTFLEPVLQRGDLKTLAVVHDRFTGKPEAV
jgi:hypothetical protein